MWRPRSCIQDQDLGEQFGISSVSHWSFRLIVHAWMRWKVTIMYLINHFTMPTQISSHDWTWTPWRWDLENSGPIDIKRGEGWCVWQLIIIRRGWQSIRNEAFGNLSAIQEMNRQKVAHMMWRLRTFKLRCLSCYSHIWWSSWSSTCIYHACCSGNQTLQCQNGMD